MDLFQISDAANLIVLAQAGGIGGGGGGGMLISPLVIPIVALFIPMIVVPAALFTRHLRRRRELEHAERMHALELGRPFPGDHPRGLGVEKASAGIGVAVPLGALFAGWMMCESFGFQEEIWIGSTIVAITGVLCGTILAGLHIVYKGRAGSADPHFSAMHGKGAAYDPDTFDVVGTRG